LGGLIPWKKGTNLVKVTIMSQPNVNLEERIKDWKRGRLSTEEVQSLAADIGNTHTSEGIPELVRMLEHTDEIVRYNAVNSLCFEFHYVPVVGKLLDMLATDSDEDCRRVAAGGLGNLCANTKNRTVMSSLAKAVLGDRDEYVRTSAYKSVLIINGVSRDEHLELLRHEKLSIDLAKMNTILEEVGR
jgi:HEAT repeat protein